MTRLPLIVAACAALLGAAPPSPAAPHADIAAFAWLGGNWIAGDDRSWSEERWSPPRGRTMIGTGLSGTGDRAASFEYMRIAADDRGAISFWGSPGGAPAVAFALVSVSAGEAVFANPAHDYPTRIHYRRTGDTLVATVSGPDGRNPQSWTYRRSR